MRPRWTRPERHVRADGRLGKPRSGRDEGNLADLSRLARPKQFSMYSDIKSVPALSDFPNLPFYPQPRGARLPLVTANTAARTRVGTQTPPAVSDDMIRLETNYQVCCRLSLYLASVLNELK